jgi:ribosomal protein L37AE/L43A
MFAQVCKEVSSCTVCNRVKANFKVEDPTLKPLPIMGMFYRWGVDLCRMPFKSVLGNRYVVVMIEHFSKWIELVPIPEKTSHHTAAALRGVLCRYGAPAEVLTDQGEKFQGEFAELLTKLLIDHRLTSRHHPQSDGQAERMVQKIKKALRKYVLKSDSHHWDVQLCWIAMGYRMSRQNSLAGYSPYFLLFGRWPIIGTAIRKVYSKVADLDDPKTWARVVEERARVFKKEMPIGFNNLAIAHHRDTLCYAHTRSGDYKPKLKRFEVGDLVYLKRQKADSMDPRVGRIILRIAKVEPNGRLFLEEHDRKQIHDHVENCAPCHPNIDLWQNPQLAKQDLHQACQVCKKTGVKSEGLGMLLCDKCNAGWHMTCLDPVVRKVPKGDWFCPRCAPKSETDVVT